MHARRITVDDLSIPVSHARLELAPGNLVRLVPRLPVPDPRQALRRTRVAPYGRRRERRVLRRIDAGEAVEVSHRPVGRARDVHERLEAVSSYRAQLSVDSRPVVGRIGWAFRREA